MRERRACWGPAALKWCLTWLTDEALCLLRLRQNQVSGLQFLVSMAILALQRLTLMMRLGN